MIVVGGYHRHRCPVTLTLTAHTCMMIDHTCTVSVTTTGHMSLAVTLLAVNSHRHHHHHWQPHRSRYSLPLVDA